MATTSDDVLTGDRAVVPPRVRPLEERDWPQVHEIVTEVARVGETYAMTVPVDEAATRAFWSGELLAVAVDPDDDGLVLGTARAGANRPAQGAHVGTASFMVGDPARGRGVGRALGEHVVAWHREQGFRGIQFNGVVDSNAAALHLWRSLGFATVGRVPGGFRRPTGELVDLHVMYLDLSGPRYTDVPAGDATDDRHRVMLAAARSFADRGWTGTSTDVVAAEADVEPELVERLFPSKAALLWVSSAHVVMTPYTDLLTWVEDVAGRDHAGVDECLDALVGVLCDLQLRIAPLVPTLNEAAALDSDALSMRQGSDLRRLRTSRRIVRMLQRGPQLERDAAELVQVLMMSETYLGFVRNGWTTARYARWLRGALDRAVNGDLARG